MLPIFREPEYEEDIRDSSYTPGRKRQRHLYQIRERLFRQDKRVMGLIVYSPNYCAGSLDSSKSE